MKNDNIAYFSDGHAEVITEFEISKDFKDVWFTVESGRNYVYKEELICNESGTCCPSYKFYKHQFVRHYDEFGAKWDVEYFVTDEIEKIRLFIIE